MPSWTVARSVTDGTDTILASDHNTVRADLEYLGGSDGNTKTGPYTIASTLTVSTGGASITGNVTVSSGTIILPNGSASAPSIAPSGDSNTGTFYPAADTIAWATGGSERVRVNSSGSVGIGTSSPQQLLHVVGNVLVGDGNKLYIQNPNGENPYLRGSDAGGQHNIQVVSTNGTVRLHVDTYGGNVGIGTSSPGYQLTLSTDSAAKPTSNTWTISSDARVKTVLGDFTRGLMDIVGLMPKRYHLNGAYGTVDDGREHVSVIAQDVQTTWPAMVGEYTHVEKDEEAGTETETTLLSLNTNELQWALVNAIKELTARVVTLEAQIASA